jgi:hypothetical protein
VHDKERRRGGEGKWIREDWEEIDISTRQDTRYDRRKFGEKEGAI